MSHVALSDVDLNERPHDDARDELDWWSNTATLCGVEFTYLDLTDLAVGGTCLAAVGSGIAVLAAVNVWNPVGWALIGGGLVAGAVYLVFFRPDQGKVAVPAAAVQAGAGGDDEDVAPRLRQALGDLSKQPEAKVIRKILEAKDKKHQAKEKELADKEEQLAEERAKLEHDKKQFAAERETKHASAPDCSICTEHEADRVLLPCGHIICATCIASLLNRVCPFCRRPFTAVQRLHCP